MTALCFQYDSVMLAAGTPNLDVPDKLKELAKKYIHKGHNQYTVNKGSARLRDAISVEWSKPLGRKIDPENEITITCGATEALLAVALATVNPQDKVIVFEPYYENFRNIVLLAGGEPIFVPLIPYKWEPDWDILEREAKNAKLLILNSPHNPTGSVLDENTIQKIARIAIQNDLFVLSDETYRTMVYDVEEPNSIASLPGMMERTAVISSFSKTMTATGWRVGFFIASADFTEQIRKVHDFSSICAPAPFQDAIAEFITSRDFDSYYNDLINKYKNKRDLLCDALRYTDFIFSIPQGAYYILADFSNIKPELDDFKMAEFMAKEIGVCVVGGRAFFDQLQRGKKYLRFSFARKISEIEDAAQKIKNIR